MQTLVDMRVYFEHVADTCAPAFNPHRKQRYVYLAGWDAGASPSPDRYPQRTLGYVSYVCH